MSRANGWIGWWARCKAPNQRFDPQERTATHDRYAPAFANLAKRCIAEICKTLCLDGLPWIKNVDEVVWCTFPLFACGFARTEGEVAIDLNAVGAHDLSIELLGEPYRELGLAASRGANHDEKFIR